MKAHKQILLVDDDPDDHEMVISAFQTIDPEIIVKSAFSAIEGLKHARKEKPDIIILDINMPVTDGLSFLKLIKADSSINDIPIVVYCTASGDFNEEKTIVLGAKRYIQKPSRYHEIQDKMREVLQVQEA
ncbi:MAG: response regulator [Bacteroidota bacterium]|nr:response regulator [Bacteroidota bacterium]